MNKHINKTFEYILAALVCSVFISSTASCSPIQQVGVDDIKYINFDKYISEASERAKAWSTDAYLTHVNTTISLVSNNSPHTISYTYRTINNPANWLIVFVHELNGEYVLESTTGEFEEGSSRPLPESIELDDMISAQDAIRIALESGGEAFIIDHQGIDDESFVQAKQHNTATAKGQIELIVCLSASNRKVMYITINPTTGEVIGIRRNDY